ncbi:MAG: ester cyclase [Calditrichia bacterium]
MKASEVVSKLISAIESEDYSAAEKLINKSGAVTGVGPNPISLDEFLNVHRALSSGLPDFRFNHKIITEDGNRVMATVHLTGTHSREMKAPLPGMRNIPATNRQVKMPEEHIQIWVDKDKISKIELEKVEGGGLPGILKQLGVEMPKQAKVA